MEGLRYFLIFLVIFGIIHCAFAALKEPKVYAKNVAKRMVAILEENQITSELFGIRSFEKNINITQFGLNVEGKIKFHSGFVNKIASGHLDDKKFSSAIGERESMISMTFMLDDVQIVCDVDYNLKDFVESGSIIFDYGDVNFVIEIRRKHSTKKVEPTIAYVFTNTGGQYEMDISVFPSNGFTQLISKQLKREKEFRHELEESFNDWKTPILNALRKVVAETPFPEIVYYNEEKERMEDNENKELEMPNDAN